MVSIVGEVCWSLVNVTVSEEQRHRGDNEVMKRASGVMKGWIAVMNTMTILTTQRPGCHDERTGRTFSISVERQRR